MSQVCRDCVFFDTSRSVSVCTKKTEMIEIDFMRFRSVYQLKKGSDKACDLAKIIPF